MGCGASSQPNENEPTQGPAPAPAPASTPAPAKPNCTGLVVTGPPASGKGKLIKELVADLKLKQINTVGAVRLRQAAYTAECDAAKEAGREVQMQPGFAEVVKVGECTQQGQEIPADVMATLLSLRVNDDDCTENGWLLDGYPREKHHSEALVKAGLVPSKIIVMKVPEQVLIDNQCHRRIDPEDQKIYDARDADVPEEVKARWDIRMQDQEDVVKAKIEQYEQQTAGMLSGFPSNLILEIDGSKQDIAAMVAAVKAGM